MDQASIIITANVAYCIMFLIMLFKRMREYDEKVWMREDGKQISMEFYGYSLAGGLTYLVMVPFPLIRNYHILNYEIPFTFIAQFVAQVIILFCYFIDTKESRYIISWGIGTFLIFLFLNALFRIQPEVTKLELTSAEVEKINTDLEHFSKDITERISRVNRDMNSVLKEIQQRQKQIDAVNDLLREKQKEQETINTTLEVGKEKVDALLTALGVRPATLTDRLIDAGIGAFLGLFLSIAWNRFFGKRVRVDP